MAFPSAPTTESDAPRLCDAFFAIHDVSAMSDIEAARAVYDAKIDILRRSQGFTQGARPAS